MTQPHVVRFEEEQPVRVVRVYCGAPGGGLQLRLRDGKPVPGTVFAGTALELEGQLEPRVPGTWAWRLEPDDGSAVVEPADAAVAWLTVSGRAHGALTLSCVFTPAQGPPREATWPLEVSPPVAVELVGEAMGVAPDVVFLDGRVNLEARLAPPSAADGLDALWSFSGGVERDGAAHTGLVARARARAEDGGTVTVRLVARGTSGPTLAEASWSPRQVIQARLEAASQDHAGFVAPEQLKFLIGEGRWIALRIVGAPADAAIDWQVTPIGDSGTIDSGPPTGQELTFFPRIARGDRPASGSRLPNDPVAYEVVARLRLPGGAVGTVSARLEQDVVERMRQEYLDLRICGPTDRPYVFEPPPHELFRSKEHGDWGPLDVATNGWFKNNYALLRDRQGRRGLSLDVTAGELFREVEARYPAAYHAAWGNDGVAGQLTVSSTWRNPQRNLAVGGAPQSMHMEGRAFDCQVAGYTGAARRRRMLVLYRLGLSLGLTQTILEHEARFCWPMNRPIPYPPRPAETGPNEDEDRDGLLDRLTVFDVWTDQLLDAGGWGGWGGYESTKWAALDITTTRVSELIDAATHVHMAR